MNEASINMPNKKGNDFTERVAAATVRSGKRKETQAISIFLLRKTATNVFREREKEQHSHFQINPEQN